MKSIVVSKFGGSSLADGQQFFKVKEIVLSDSSRRYIIPSAPGKRDNKDHKITDMFYLCHKLSHQNLPFGEVFALIKKRYEDIVLELDIQLDLQSEFNTIQIAITNGASEDFAASRGEYLNGLILAKFLGFNFIDATNLIFFNKNGLLDVEKTKNAILNMSKEVEFAVIPGFYGVTENGKIKTFSRGGSDITGAIISDGLNAGIYENWTDVSGLLMADPRVVASPNIIEKISYKELRELSYMGASVLHEEAIFPVKKSGIPINIRNTNRPSDPGTLIVPDLEPVEYPKSITGIAGKKNFCVIAIEKVLMIQEKGFLRKLLDIAEEHNLIIEHMPSGIDSVSLVISEESIKNNLDDVIQEIKKQLSPDSVDTFPNMSLIAIVGRGMIRTKGISSRVFTALKNADVNIRMITQGSSEINIIVGIENSDFEKGIIAIYNEFEE